MKNIEVLQSRRKKLSIYFSLFLILTIWLVVWFYDISTYFTDKNQEIRELENKVLQVQNIIKNKQIFVKAEELTLKKLIRQVLEDSIIIYQGKTVVDLIQTPFDITSVKNKKWIEENGYMYIFWTYGESDEYTIIVRKESRNPVSKVMSNFLYFCIFTLPLVILFYFLWYFLIGKSFEPIKRSIKNLEDFNTNINHEFKTPLAEIISTLELSKRTHDYENSTESALTSSKKLLKILENLGFMISFTSPIFKNEKINIYAISKTVEEWLSSKIKEKNITLQYKSHKPIYKNINEQHYYICFSNLLSNAIKYSKNNGIIEIDLTPVFFSIKDFWIWIEKENVDKIFEKYFRENYNVDGSGVWLSIVKKICDIHNWKVEIESKKDTYTQAKITF